jgi:twinkle protein
MAIILPSSLNKEFKSMKAGGMYRAALTTGFDTLDKNIKLAKGYMMINTGYPSSGKSEFLDAILVNMALLHGWKTMYFSPENFPTEEHMAKIGEKYIGTNLRSFTNTQDSDALEFMHEYYSWMDIEDPYLDSILGHAMEQKAKHGLDCLVIDPWNNVYHERGGLREDEYLSECLDKILRFARVNKIFLAIVAHPKNPQKDKNGQYPIPDLYCISGGAMWRNKADYGVCYHRPNMAEPRLEVMIQKIKQKWMGKVGVETFDYDLLSGRFKGTAEKEFLLPHEIAVPF